MFKSVFALFALVLHAAFVLSYPAATPVVVHKRQEDLFVFSTCNEVNFDSCFDWVAPSLPLACTNLASSGQTKLVKSCVTGNGIECTLFTNTDCTGGSQLIVGPLDDLNLVGFSDLAESFSCQAL
ncbi:hypothetical protein GYMLUDRAFT_648101 [Collybiopsis luxurians FD-317 M1]|nr:hypothetical protein GYMLUDRAFT_648101 [Collybiopsis luxurians FD-317 M1]